MNWIEVEKILSWLTFFFLSPINLVNKQSEDWSISNLSLMYFHSICSIIVKFEGAFKDLAMKHKEVKLLVHLLFNSWVSFF